MIPLNHTFTSTGAKFFAHQEAMRSLRDGKGRPIVTHLMPTDICNHTCAFCSVQTREGNVLAFADMMSYLDTLIRFGLKSVIISGGGNPILYRDRQSGKDFNDLVAAIKGRGLEIGLISNGVPTVMTDSGRRTWKGVSLESLDACTWIRISMAGLDHKENQVFVPDIDPLKTTLGFSYILHDIYDEPGDLNHGKVSRPEDLISTENIEDRVIRANSRIDELTAAIDGYVKRFKPVYVRLLPNCLEPQHIPDRCTTLQGMANLIDPNVVFVQYKPPSAPKACYLGYVHPVLNSDGFVYPCDSCVLNEEAQHKFANSWRVCHWSDIASIYESPVRSLIKNPGEQCPGCVFPKSNQILGTVVDGSADLTPPTEIFKHVNFV